MDRKARNRFLWIHALVLAAALSLPLYRWVMSIIPPRFTGCFLHDYLFLYCPTCGGTRALEALLRFQLLDAVKYNLFVVLLCLSVLVIDVRALVRLLRGEKRLYVISGKAWVIFAVCLVLYFVLRNYLMIAHGIDPVGDLGAIWRARMV